MTRSANELEMLFRNACRGVGLARGVADDNAGAALWLCGCGVDGAAVLHAALTRLDATTLASPPQVDRPVSEAEDAAPLDPQTAWINPMVARLGPSAWDIAMAAAFEADGQAVRQVHLTNIRDLPLLIAQGALAARRQRMTVGVDITGCDARIIMTSDGMALTAMSGAETAQLPKAWLADASLHEPTDVRLSAAPVGEERDRADDASTSAFPSASPSASPWASVTGHADRRALHIDDAAIAGLKAFAARMLVPSSDQSRARGAGAGLTDND